MSFILILFTLLLLNEYFNFSICNIWTFLGLSISKYARRTKRYKEVEIIFDSIGELPEIKKVYKEIITKVSKVATLRVNNNSTIVAYSTNINKNCTTDNNQIIETIKCKPLYKLCSGYHILLTGLAGDCRELVRYSKQVVLNYTVDYDMQPSGSFVASRVADYCSKFTMGKARRPVGCHAYIIANNARHWCGVWEIHASGAYRQINAGCAGRNMDKANAAILKDYSGSNITLNNAQELLDKVFNVTSNGSVESNQTSINNNRCYTTEIFYDT